MQGGDERTHCEGLGRRFTSLEKQSRVPMQGARALRKKSENINTRWARNAVENLARTRTGGYLLERHSVVLGMARRVVGRVGDG